MVAATGTFNPLVAGSNPARPTKIHKNPTNFGSWAFLRFALSEKCLIPSSGQSS